MTSNIFEITAKNLPLQLCLDIEGNSSWAFVLLLLLTNNKREIIYVLRWKSHLYYSERNLIIDNDSGISNLFIFSLERSLPSRKIVVQHKSLVQISYSGAQRYLDVNLKLRLLSDRFSNLFSIFKKLITKSNFAILCHFYGKWTENLHLNRKRLMTWFCWAYANGQPKGIIEGQRDLVVGQIWIWICGCGFKQKTFRHFFEKQVFEELRLRRGLASDNYTAPLGRGKVTDIKNISLGPKQFQAQWALLS